MNEEKQIVIKSNILTLDTHKCITTNTLNCYKFFLNSKKIRPSFTGQINGHKIIDDYIIIESSCEDLLKNDNIILISIRKEKSPISCRVIDTFKNKFKIEKNGIFKTFDYTYTKWTREADSGYIDINLNNTSYIKENLIDFNIKELSAIRSITLKNVIFDKNVIPIKYFFSGSSKFEYGLYNSCIDYFCQDKVLDYDTPINSEDWAVSVIHKNKFGQDIEIGSIFTDLARKLLMIFLFPNKEISDIFSLPTITNREIFPFGTLELNGPSENIKDHDSLESALESLCKNGDFYNLYGKKIPSMTDILSGKVIDNFHPVTLENIKCTLNPNILGTSIRKQNFIEYIQKYIETHKKNPELVIKLSSDLDDENIIYTNYAKCKTYKKIYSIPLVSLRNINLYMFINGEKVDIENMIRIVYDYTNMKTPFLYHFSKSIKFIFEIENYEYIGKLDTARGILESKSDYSEKYDNDLTFLRASNT